MNDSTELTGQDGGHPAIDALKAAGEALVGADTERARRTDKEISDLKNQWKGDPCWDIEDTEGFEAHYADLYAWRRAYEAENRTKRIESEANRLRPYVEKILADMSVVSPASPAPLGHAIGEIKLKGRWEINTLIQDLDDAPTVADIDLENALNDGWEIVNLTITSDSESIVTGAWRVHHFRVVTLKRWTVERDEQAPAASTAVELETQELESIPQDDGAGVDEAAPVDAVQVAEVDAVRVIVPQEHNIALFLTAPEVAIRPAGETDSKALLGGRMSADEYMTRFDDRMHTILNDGMERVREKWADWRPMGFGEVA